jgi:N6-adenosine-specific RNA methylase IME4
MNAPALFEPLRPWAFDALRPHGYNLIVADPPWKFKAYSQIDGGGHKGAAAQYDCLPAQEIVEKFPIGDLAEPECLLLCWATMPLLPRQIEAVARWGFVYKSALVWRKTTINGKQSVGTGYRVRAMAEVVILATRGEPRHKPFPGLFDGLRREHSRKPETFYALVDRCCPGLTRRADVFVRERRPGWDPFGNQIDHFAERP